VFNKKVVEMEADVLKTLNYEVGNPTIKTFLRLVPGKSCTVDSDVSQLGKMIGLLYIHVVKAC